ncbi:transposase, partial [Paraburkholderia gardini]|uniref:transposase n=1 Tax=Paraburkholderia gardini TaxID=2823469 RepID=UPI001E5A257B
MPVSRLPDDIDTLKRMLVSREETIARLLAEISRLRRWQYGRSSERMAELTGQLQLALSGGALPQQDAVPAPAPEPVPDEPVDTTAPAVPLRRRSREFPAH